MCTISQVLFTIKTCVEKEDGGGREEAFEDPVLNKGLTGTQLTAAIPVAAYYYHKHNDDGFQVLPVKRFC